MNPYLFYFWILSIPLGAVVAWRRDSLPAGALLGLIAGPLGVIAAAYVDIRPRCRACGERVNRSYPICHSCGSKQKWSDRQWQPVDQEGTDAE